jgi:hypothetical protein
VHVFKGRFEFVNVGATSSASFVAAGETLVVPKGAWHTAVVHEAGEALHVTHGNGTVHRPATT